MRIKRLIEVIFLILSITFFVLGVIFPLLSTKHQIMGIVLDYHKINLFDSIMIFFNNKEYLLATVIFVFTFLFPVLKFVELTFACIKNKNIKLMGHLDKWSMLDVFLVALLLLNFKMDSNIIVMQLRIGTSFIALSVIFRILTITLITNQIPKK